MRCLNKLLSRRRLWFLPLIGSLAALASVGYGAGANGGSQTLVAHKTPVGERHPASTSPTLSVRVPSTAREVSLKVATGRGREDETPGRTIGERVAITGRAKVRTVRKAVDQLHKASLRPINCPAIPASPRYLWITFRAHHPAGWLARARVDLVACGEGADVALTVPGHSTTALTGSRRLIGMLEHALHLHVGREGVNSSARPSACPGKAVLALRPNAVARAANAALAYVAHQPDVAMTPNSGQGARVIAAIRAPHAGVRGRTVKRSCGPRVWKRTVLVRMFLPNLKSSASLSKEVVFVSRFAHGYRVWGRPGVRATGQG